MAASELTQRCWAIAEGLGKPTPEPTKIYEAICDEMMHVPIERHVALSVAGYVAQWKKTKNPYYVDAAFMLLADAGGSATETMIQEDLAARRARFDGSPAGTPDSIKKQDADWSALLVMANFVCAGLSIGSASRKAVSYYLLRFPHLKPKKASTLEKYYLEKFRQSGIEADFFSAWRASDDDSHGHSWRDIAAALPDCPEPLIGNVRA